MMYVNTLVDVHHSVRVCMCVCVPALATVD